MSPDAQETLTRGHFSSTRSQGTHLIPLSCLWSVPILTMCACLSPHNTVTTEGRGNESLWNRLREERAL